MDKGRKYCRRCGKEIRRSWITLDEKKYYHPHCFNCGDCGVMIESVNEYSMGTATLEDVYCPHCHYLRCKPYKSNATNQVYRSNNPRMKVTTPTVSCSSSSDCFKNLTDDDNNVDILLSPPSPYSIHKSNEKSCDQYDQDDQAINCGTKRRQIRKKIKDNCNYGIILEAETKTKLQNKSSRVNSLTEKMPSAEKKIEILLNHNRSRSLIPRPISAQSKKSLAIATTELSSKSKVALRFQNENAKISTVRAQTRSKQNMHRSISLVQTKQSDEIKGSVETSLSAKIKSNRSSRTRPLSAVSCAQDHQVLTNNNQNFVNTSNSYCDSPAASKRHCAASFVTKRKKSKSDAKLLKFKSCEDHYPSHNYQTQLSNDTMYTYPKLKGGIPTTQAILSAIQKGSDDINNNVESPVGTQLADKENYEVLPVDIGGNSNILHATNLTSVPIRSFSMSFECPICISSLVPSSGNNEKGCMDGRNSCSNIVTPCGHLFHGKCMENWLKIKGNKRCPICSAICLPETLIPVYLECNLCADLNSPRLYPHTGTTEFPNWDECKNMVTNTNVSFQTLRSEYELLKAKYNTVVAENHNYCINLSMVRSLQSAYDMECRNRLQLQWENRKLLMKIEELKTTSLSG